MKGGGVKTRGASVPELTSVQRDLLHVLQAAVNSRAPDGAPADWQAVWRLACVHELDAYLFSAVCAWPATCRPPQPLVEEWRRAFLTRTVAAVRASWQLGELLAALHAAGVQAMPVKGAWLAEHAYDDTAHRPMHDLDLLVRQDQLAAARRAFAAAGYRTSDPAEPGAWCKDQHFRHPDYALGAELQWQVWTARHAQLTAPDMDRFWSQTLPTTVAGQQAVALPPARHVLYLIYHLLAHHWLLPARAHLDLVQLGRRYAASLPTDALATEARAWGLAFRAPFVWRVAHDLCGAIPPAPAAGWAPTDTRWLQNERSAAVAAALPESPARVNMSPSFSDFHQTALWRRPAMVLRLVFLPAEVLRLAHPLATRRFGLVGGYAARVGDRMCRRARDLLPGAARRVAVDAAAADMAARLRLDRWLQAQE